MAYRKEIESRLVRIRHIIDFNINGTRAIDIKDILAHVPDEAIIVAIVQPTEAGFDSRPDYEIWFEEEKEEGK